MLNSTLHAIKAVLEIEPSLSNADRARILADASNWPKTKTGEAATTEPPRLLRASEVANRLACTPKTVYRLSRAGILKKRLFPGRKRASGFLKADVDALLLG
jgi:hypothetical protein